MPSGCHKLLKMAMGHKRGVNIGIGTIPKYADRLLNGASVSENNSDIGELRTDFSVHSSFTFFPFTGVDFYEQAPFLGDFEYPLQLPTIGQPFFRYSVDFQATDCTSSIIHIQR